MSIRLTGGLFLMPSSGLQDTNEKSNNNLTHSSNNETNNQHYQQNHQHQEHQHQHQHQQQQHNQYHHQMMTKTVTIVSAGPQRSNSLDYLNFEEKRQIIASSLSLSDFLAHGPAAAAAAAKEVAANTVVIGKYCHLFIVIFFYQFQISKLAIGHFFSF